jgi:TonB family protein
MKSANWMKRFLPFVLISLMLHSFIIVILGGLVSTASMPQPIRFPYLKVTLKGPIEGIGLLLEDIAKQTNNSGESQKEKGQTLKPNSLKMIGHESKNKHPHSPFTLGAPVKKTTFAPPVKPLSEEYYQSVDLQKTPEPSSTASGALSSEEHVGSNTIPEGGENGTAGSGAGTGSDSVGTGREGYVDPSRLGPFMDTIRKRIERNQSYPLWARRNNIEGIVIVRFTLTRKGQIQDLNLEHSSGSTILDEAAKDAVLRGVPYPAFPNWLPDNRFPVKIPICFTFGESSLNTCNE